MAAMGDGGDLRNNELSSVKDPDGPAQDPDGPVLGIAGCGSWGTALAVSTASMGRRVILWGRTEDGIEETGAVRENRRFLPGVELPPGIETTPDIGRLGEAPIVAIVVPSSVTAGVAGLIEGVVGKGRIVVSAVKGLEPGRRRRMSEVISERLPGVRIAVLSGPSHAEEVARGLPTTATVASNDPAAAGRVMEALSTPRFRLYSSSDIIGVELGGALKNPIAIAAGIASGLGYGDNAMGALLTRGLAEIARLGVALGADPLTFQGLSGMGDLVTTAISGHSRNRRVGLGIAEGRAVEDILDDLGMVAEGVATVREAVALARESGIEVPIMEAVERVVFEGTDARSEVEALMIRPPRDEMEGIRDPRPVG